MEGNKKIAKEAVFWYNLGMNDFLIKYRMVLVITVIVLMMGAGFYFLYWQINLVKTMGLDLSLKFSELSSTMERLDINTERLENRIVLLKEQGYVEIDDVLTMTNNILPSVVFIINKPSDVSEYNKGDKVLMEDESNIRGTGFFISTDGYIVTAKHVISGLVTQDIEIKDVAGSRYQVEEVFTDQDTDIGLIKIETNKKHPVATFGYFENLKIGDEIGIIGFNPGFNIPLLHRGNISGKGLDENDSKLFTINSFVNKGNSGSPVFSIKTGRVLGILSSRKSDVQIHQLLDADKFTSGVVFGGIDPIHLSAELYNNTVKIVEGVSQVGIGIVYPIDIVRELMEEYK